MSPIAPRSQLERSVRMLRSGFGPRLIAWLADPEIVEIMLNPDGRLWLDRLGDPRRWISSRHGGPGTRAVSARSTRGRPAAPCAASSNWCRRQ